MRILVTGSTGFVGGAVAAQLLNDGFGPSLLLLVRARTRSDGLARVRAAMDRFRVAAVHRLALGEANIVCGDLAQPVSFEDDPRMRSVTHVVHAGAIASFSAHPQLDDVNVAGTLALARAVAASPVLERFVHVGTAMACGDSLSGLVRESPDLALADHQVVPYTASKAEAERRLRREWPGLPLVIARPSIVVGHTRLGCEPSGSIFWMFRMVQLLGAFTCGLDDRLDVVPVDFCANALIDLAFLPHLRHDLYHVSAGEGSTRTIRQIEAALATARGVVPLGERFRHVDDAEIARLTPALARQLGQGNSRLMAKALRRYGAFAALDYVFDNRRLLSEGTRPPAPVTDYLEVCVRSSEATSVAEQMAWDFK
ncbi:SDR family oxidoreductase [Pandoraea communis]|uniref:SDR family oxidoreductase n=1 Tax=Pandoraea communis TaxID=2508297 RepID=UPI0025A57563|nr:SDR family oxidoreductase [Pandoraea communis]MDM8358233.1 SDR family oxidoreductase [Pandoraea communis]